MSAKTGFLTKFRSDTGRYHSPIFSIANQLRYGLVLFVLFSLLLTGGILIYLSFQAQVRQTVFAEQKSSLATASEINAYLDDLQRKLSYLARVRGLTDLSPEIQQSLLEGLIRHNNAYRATVVLDHTGQVVTAASAPGAAGFQDNLADSPLFSRTFKQQEEFVGPVEREGNSQQLYVTLAVPIRDQQDQVAGVLAAQINLDFLDFIVSQVDVGDRGYAYVVDNRQFVIARTGGTLEAFEFENLSERPFYQALLSGASENLATYEGLDGVTVLGAIAPIRNVRWNVVVELPTAAAYRPVYTMLLVMGIALIVVAGLAVGGGIVIARQIVKPLDYLTEKASQISAGNIDVVVDVVGGHDEIGVLATAFKQMTSQIRQLVGGLEDRTRRLEIVALVSERLSAILQLEELMVEVVQQVQRQFGYYHVQIYLLDERREYLVLAEGAGEVGAKMKSSGRRIPLTQSTHLLVQALRHGKVMKADNAREAADWQPDPLLPDICAEIAAPIMVEEQVVGVLAVQADKVAGLDENDVNLLRSVANQVAVAIRNARLFAQVETALAEAQAAQEQYVEQSWDKSRLRSQRQRYWHIRPGAEPLDEAKQLTLLKIQQDWDGAPPRNGASSRDGVEVASDEVQVATGQSLMAPITLRNRQIGAVQLFTAAKDQSWTAEDLAIIETVLDQVAQTAENLRLFEETRQRADYERLVGEITQKIRQAPTLEVLAKTASQELSNALGVSYGIVRVGTTPKQQKPRS